MMRKIALKANSGERLTEDDALWLYNHADLLELGALANRVNLRKNGKAVYYNINRHINPTNICSLSCKFCAYSKKIGEEGGYAYEIDEMIKKAGEAVAQGATELHMVGGLHPRWGFQRYVDMIAAMHQAYPEVHLKAFTAVELDWMARKSRKTVAEVMTDLQAAGLGSLPGGGAEIFHPEVRDAICDTKVSGQQWIDTHRTAHKLGLRSNCTMLYGHIEKFEHRVDHMRQLRELQDETGGFNVFIPLAFQPFQNEMGVDRYSFGADDLRTIAISRLYLDNFKNIKSYWVMLGQDIAQLALQFGANDLDGTVLEEKISRAAGGRAGMIMTRSNLESLIRRSDRIPVERTTLYQPVHENDRVHLQPLTQEMIAPDCADMLRSLTAGDTMSPSNLWRLATITPMHELGEALAHSGKAPTKALSMFECVLVQLNSEQSKSCFENALREQFATHRTKQWTMSDSPVAVVVDCDHIKAETSIFDTMSVIRSVSTQSAVTIRGISWIPEAVLRKKMRLVEFFAELKSIGLHALEESILDGKELSTDQKWELFAAAQAADIAVIPNVCLTSLAGTADWSSWADAVTEIRTRLAVNNLIFAITLQIDPNATIMPSELMRAIALTRLTIPTPCEIWTPLTGISTLSPQKGIGANQDHHPVMKLVSVLSGFGSASLGMIPSDSYSLMRLAEDILASGYQPEVRSYGLSSVSFNETAKSAMAQLRHIPLRTLRA